MIVSDICAMPTWLGAMQNGRHQIGEHHHLDADREKPRTAAGEVPGKLRAVSGWGHKGEGPGVCDHGYQVKPSYPSPFAGGWRPRRTFDALPERGKRHTDGDLLFRGPGRAASMARGLLAGLMTPVILITLGFATLLVLVSVLVPIAKRLQLPFTVLLAIVGAALGFAPYLSGGDLGSFKVVIDALGALQIPAEGFLYVFLPPLLFAGGLTVDVRRLFDDIWPVLVLAIVAVLMCMIAVGVTLNLVTGTSLMLCLLLGAIVATTDTAAVLGIFRDIGVPSRLSVIVEGESLFNDAAAIALFVVILEVVSGHGEANLGRRRAGVRVGLLGRACVRLHHGVACRRLDSQLRGAAVTEITISVALAYMTFVVGQAFLHISGIIAVVTAAMIFASDTRTRLSPGTWETLQITWRQLEFWGTSLIFILAAMLAPRMLGSVQWIDAAAIGALFVAALIARAIVLWLLLPVLSWFGLSQPISNVYKIVLCWGGLRGAVTIALALLAASELGGSAYGPELPPEARFIFVMAMGYVLATLLIAAPTLRPLMKFLKLDKLSPEERLVRDRVMALSRGRVRENLVQVAHALGLSDCVVRQTEQMVQADVVGGGKLGRDDLVLAGLIVVANRETELSLEYLQRGLVGRTVAERLRADAGRVLDGVRLGKRGVSVGRASRSETLAPIQDGALAAA